MHISSLSSFPSANNNFFLNLLLLLSGESHVFISVCLSVSITGKCITDFHEIFMIISAWKKDHPVTIGGRLFHTCLDCFTFLKLGMTQVGAARVLLVLEISLLRKKIHKSLWIRHVGHHCLFPGPSFFFTFRKDVNPGSCGVCQTNPHLKQSVTIFAVSKSRFSILWSPFLDMTKLKMLTCVGFNPVSASH